MKLLSGDGGQSLVLSCRQGGHTPARPAGDGDAHAAGGNDLAHLLQQHGGTIEVHLQDGLDGGLGGGNAGTVGDLQEGVHPAHVQDGGKHGAKLVGPLAAQQGGQDGQKPGFTVQAPLVDHLVKGKVVEALDKLGGSLRKGGHAAGKYFLVILFCEFTDGHLGFLLTMFGTNYLFSNSAATSSRRSRIFRCWGQICSHRPHLMQSLALPPSLVWILL